jgi:membrane-associated phospholipid phosphatase
LSSSVHVEDETISVVNAAPLALLATLVVGAQPATEAPAQRPPSLKQILREVPGDFRRFGTRESIVTLAAGGALALAVHSKDADITRAAAESEPLDAALELGSPLGSGYVMAGAAAGAYFIGLLAHNTAVASTGADLLAAQLVNGIATQGIKIAVQRERPDGGNYSFPSGHASATFATATVLQRRFGWKVGIPFYALGVYVGASRIQDREHYLSDVIFGAALGTVSGRVVTIHTPAGRLKVAPVAVKRGVAVMFTRVSRP